MKVLVIGSGAREHALVWKISQSKKVSKIYSAPGNGGIAELAECVNIRADDIEMLLSFALKEKIDLTVVGPEAPLVKGIGDLFRENNLKIFGPGKGGALLEGSKVYAKDFMQRYGIPTAKYHTYDEADLALKALEAFNYPIVIKADGLAAGKGVIICHTLQEGEGAILEIMENKRFGDSGDRIIIEEYLEGVEASLLCLIDGKQIIPMESARDYKKIYEDDQGPNTGGMGCYSPNELFTPALKDKIKGDILDKIVDGLQKETIDYRGILFIGLMMTKEGPKVLEFNVRLGDPETEVILPRLENDLVDIMEKTVSGQLKEEELKWSPKTYVTVIAASGGYPEDYKKNKVITGLNQLDQGIMVFHGGTKFAEAQFMTNGGRVLAVTGYGDSLKEARDSVYHNIKKIHFEDMFYRRDIGALKS